MIVAKFWAYFSSGADISFRRGSLLSANSLPERYVYPASNPAVASIIPYPGFEFRERLRIVPPGVVSLLRSSTSSLAEHTLLHRWRNHPELHPDQQRIKIRIGFQVLGDGF